MLVQGTKSSPYHCVIDLAQSFPFIVVRWGLISIDIEFKLYLKEDKEVESRMGCGSSFHSRIIISKIIS